jgi:hypothetical protein
MVGGFERYLVAAGNKPLYILLASTERIMTRATAFATNPSRAVRLPKAVGFSSGIREVEVVDRREFERIPGLRVENLGAGAP